MKRYRGGKEESSDRLSWEIDGFYLAVDNTKNCLAAEGDYDDLTREKLNVGRIG